MDNDLMKKFLRYTSMPFEFLIIIGGSTWLGYWLDKRFGTYPWLMIAMAAFGFFAAIYHVFKTLKNK